MANKKQQKSNITSNAGTKKQVDSKIEKDQTKKRTGVVTAISSTRAYVNFEGSSYIVYNPGKDVKIGDKIEF